MSDKDRIADLTRGVTTALANLLEFKDMDDHEPYRNAIDALRAALRREACITMIVDQELLLTRTVALPERVVAPVGTKLRYLGESDIRDRIKCEVEDAPSGFNPFNGMPTAKKGDHVWVQPDWCAVV